MPFEAALEVYRTYYNLNLAVHTSTYSGVCTGIQALANAGHKLALLSNKPGDSCRMIMRQFGLDSYFVLMLGGGDLARLKPEPDGIHHCLAHTGMPISKTWMIGDHHTDLAVAQNAGIKCAYAEYGFGDNLDRKADISFSSFPGLVHYFV